MIAEKPNGFFPETAVHVFEKQIEHIAKHYKIITLDNIIERVRNKDSLRGCVAITFDDGFKDNYFNAFPILKKYNIPATIFLLTGSIKKNTAPWFIKVRYIFSKTKKTAYNIVLNGTELILPLHTTQQKFVASTKMINYLQKLASKEQILFIDKLFEDLRVTDFCEIDNLMLNWDEIKQMSKYGISFGAHTENHGALSELPLHIVEEEISNSKLAIEKEIEAPVTSFAYPFGKKKFYNKKHFQILEKYKFKCAVTSEPGVNSHNSNLFRLSRSLPWELYLLK
jgi:peptidoglycan/xylan/chitin deacetylase (PgdA/CDA1 family)